MGAQWSRRADSEIGAPIDSAVSGLAVTDWAARTGGISGTKDMKKGTSLLAFTVLVVLRLNAAADTHYVDLNSPSPTPPYTNWLMAATNIQDAIDAADPGDTVLVTNGIYATGGRLWYDSGSNRVTVTNAIQLLSVNGPAQTIIVGLRASGTNAVRCVLLGDGARISGFTLTNGQSGINNYPNGGGVYCLSTSPVVTNCIVAGNLANDSGGGVFRGTLIDCMLRGNSATNSGGGAYNANLLNCIVQANSATLGGGLRGIYGVTRATSCLIVSNTASTSGGGAHEGSFRNCTIVGNVAGSSAGGVQGGAGMDNCIVYYNTAPSFPNLASAKFNNCCIELPQPPPNIGSITNEPGFVSLLTGDFRLQSNSPCINAGSNAYVTGTNDLDGNPRIVGGTVDMGAYEAQSPAMLQYFEWLQTFGLSTKASDLFADTDNEGMNNWQEWRSDTVPTNATSALRMAAVTNAAGGLDVSWESVASRSYWLERGEDLGTVPAFQTIATNLSGVSGTKAFNDTSATNGGPYFYRVGVQ